MKLILLAATALLAAPAIAQDTTAGTAPTTQTTPPTADPAQTGQMPATDPAMAPATTDPAMAPAAGDPAAMPMQQGAMPAPGTSTMPMTTGAGNPVGGYQPTGPALQGTATPGGPVVFQQAPSPSQAYPAPAPKAEYPICKKGQFDGCRQRGGK